MRLRLVGMIVLSMAGSAMAADGLTSPYRDQAAREIRALTQQEVADFRDGRGMGLARAAELNGYPGPRHVLDAARAGQLPLTAAQLRTVQGLFDSMAQRAQRLGGQILREEQSLEGEFRTGRINEADLRARVARIATPPGQPRAGHLRTHLENRAALTRQHGPRYHERRRDAGEPRHSAQ